MNEKSSPKILAILRTRDLNHDFGFVEITPLFLSIVYQTFWEQLKENSQGEQKNTKLSPNGPFV